MGAHEAEQAKNAALAAEKKQKQLKKNAATIPRNFSVSRHAMKKTLNNLMEYVERTRYYLMKSRILWTKLEKVEETCMKYPKMQGDSRLKRRNSKLHWKKLNLHLNRKKTK